MKLQCNFRHVPKSEKNVLKLVFRDDSFYLIYNQKDAKTAKTFKKSINI